MFPERLTQGYRSFLAGRFIVQPVVRKLMCLIEGGQRRIDGFIVEDGLRVGREDGIAAL